MFDNFYYKLIEIKDNIKYRLQRIFRGYADIDIWNFDHRLMELVARHVRVLRKTTHGHPTSVQQQEEWNQILDDIVFAAEMYTSEFSDICLANTLEEYNFARDVYNKVYTDEDDLEFPDEEAWRRAQRGIKYFKQYMFALWD